MSRYGSDYGDDYRPDHYPYDHPGRYAVDAGFWLRAVAYLIDSFILGIVQWLISIPLSLGMVFTGVVASASTQSSQVPWLADAMPALVMWAISFCTGWLYFALFESSPSMATPGKMALGLQVTNAYGERIGLGQATGRYFGKILSALICYIGFIMAAFTERKQALHDQLADTYVVTR